MLRFDASKEEYKNTMIRHMQQAAVTDVIITCFEGKYSQPFMETITFLYYLHAGKLHLLLRGLFGAFFFRIIFDV